MAVTLSEIVIYPVKACRGIALESARLTPTGLEWDRSWMLVDEGGGFLTQRTHPQLARVATCLTAQELELQAPGLPPLAVPLAPSGERRPVRIWKDTCEALDQGEAAAAWASAVAGQPARLVRAGAVTQRLANPSFAGPAVPIAFPDGYPVLVCNRASLGALNARMPEPIPMSRFRPNLVLDGLEPFAEDGIDAITIDAATLRLVKPCTRCVVTSTDQQTGERSTNPLPVLRQFRFDRQLLGVTFGENAVVASGAGTMLRRGSAVAVKLGEGAAPPLSES